MGVELGEVNRDTVMHWSRAVGESGAVGDDADDRIKRQPHKDHPKTGQPKCQIGTLRFLEKSVSGQRTSDHQRRCRSDELQAEQIAWLEHALRELETSPN
jgi:hypothetical protein